MRRSLVILAAIAATASGADAVPRGWQWTDRWALGKLTVTASSEQPGRWPAAKAIDGETVDDRGTWLTYRDKKTPKPKSAWLELALEQPRRIRGVSIFHQINPGHYRSIDYTVACRVGDGWKQVAAVRGNKQGGWRAHPFPPVQTARVRITITRSEFGNRMGFNEVRLDLAPDEGSEGAAVVSPPYRCGKVAELGVITFQADVPQGESVSLRTRTAPDAGGAPGAWSAWSKPYAKSGARVASPLGEWIQYEVRRTSAGGRAPVVREVRIGSPLAVRRTQIEASVIPQPGETIALTVHFSRPMDPASTVAAERVFPRARPQVLRSGSWNDAATRWTFQSSPLGPAKGLGRWVVGGARTRDGSLTMHHEEPFAVGSEVILARLQELAQWMLDQGSTPHIFYKGYKHRTMLGLHEITGKQLYLDAARKGADELLAAQAPDGFWNTGYGSVYLADTGSALGLLINLYKFAAPEQRKRIDEALDRYVHLVLVKGDSKGRPFVHPDGSLGVGFGSFRNGKARGDLNKPYTIATALTGAEVFAALYYLRGEERYKQVAVKACNWLLATMRKDGCFPYIIEDWNPGGRDQAYMWRKYRDGTSTYVSEGLIQAWTYIDERPFRRSIEQRIAPHVEWALRTQNPDGSWGIHDRINLNESRSHGIVNLLLWYYRNVRRDPRVAAAVRRYVLLLLDKGRKSYVTLAGEDAAASKAWNARFSVPITCVSTSLAGRALIEVLKPGVDCYRWKDK